MNAHQRDSRQETAPGRRHKQRSRKDTAGKRGAATHPPVWPGLEGGRYRPLRQRDMERIHSTVMDILEKVGLADPTPSLIEIVGAAGGWMSADGRLCYPRGLVEDVIARAKRSFIWSGQSSAHDLEVGGQRVHMGTGGAAPLILDFNTGRYRETTLVDVYDITRLADTLENIHFIWRTVVARDIPNAFDLDLNTAYACMQGTSKHIGVSFVNGEHVRAAVDMFDIHLGGEGRFRKRPFCSLSCCHVVPPLRFAQPSCDALESAVMSGMPASLISLAQAGATGPATLAGTIAQAMAETLAGLVFAFLIDSQCRIDLGTWTVVSDLRTGAMSAGSPELALMVAGSAQMAGFYDLPGSVAAGMSDSKLPDAQAGAEKGYTLALAAQAGSTLIHESAGMHASLLGTAFESYVIDNDTLGAVLRTVRGIEVNDKTLAFEVIRDVATGDGHFLGQEQTIERMETDYVYPRLGDRSSPEEWEERGSKDIWQMARARVKEILHEHYPNHVDSEADKHIRNKFNILLPSSEMQPGNARW